MPRLAEGMCVGSDRCFFTWHQMPQCFTPQCPVSAPFACYLLRDISSEQDISRLHCIPERAREGGCGQIFRNLLRDPGQGSALRSSVFPSVEWCSRWAFVSSVLGSNRSTSSGNACPTVHSVSGFTWEGSPLLPGNQPQSCPRRRSSGPVFWWG